jgi:alpha-D-ribose 1-methylphosphonate 5-triphosphate diphosphatase
VVRGGSHSGGVSAEELARGGLLDALSSDYVPASLLQAVLRLAQDEATSLPEAMAFVTSRPADMLGLDDRGRLAAGLRADLVRFRVVDGTPLVREVFHGGRRVL